MLCFGKLRSLFGLPSGWLLPSWQDCAITPLWYFRRDSSLVAQLTAERFSETRMEVHDACLVFIYCIILKCKHVALLHFFQER